MYLKMLIALALIACTSSVVSAQSTEAPPPEPLKLSGPGAVIHEFDPPGEAGPGQDWVLVLSAREGL